MRLGLVIQKLQETVQKPRNVPVLRILVRAIYVNFGQT